MWLWLRKGFSALPVDGVVELGLGFIEGNRSMAGEGVVWVRREGRDGNGSVFGGMDVACCEDGMGELGGEFFGEEGRDEIV